MMPYRTVDGSRIGWLAHVRRKGWAMFRRDPRLKLLRYAIFGVAVSLGYTLNVILFVDVMGWRHPALASALCFTIWTPISYVAHRDLTFLYSGARLDAAIKFGLTFVARLAASAYTVELATVAFGMQYYFLGVLANWIVLPLISYFMLDLWVFRAKAVEIDVPQSDGAD